jgi:hypothetical protein
MTSCATSGAKRTVRGAVEPLAILATGVEGDLRMGVEVLE